MQALHVALIVYLPFILSIDLFEMNQNSSAHNLRYGDVLVRAPRHHGFNGHHKMAGVIKEKGGNRWINNVVYYTLSDQYKEHEKEFIADIIQYLTEQTCFQFIQRTNQKDYLDIRKEDGCYSYVGRVGGPQLLSLSNGCLHRHIIQHELLHSLGLEHEHQRHDRDQYIKVNYRNVERGREDNFDKIPSHLIDLYGQPYDYNSIMHYDSRAFGRYDWSNRHKMETMLPLKEGITINGNIRLSDLDLAKLRILGKCPQTNEEHRYAGKKGKPDHIKVNDGCSDMSLNCSQRLCYLDPYMDLIREYCAKTCKLC